MVKKKSKVLVSKDLDSDVFSGFTSEKERIKYMSNSYGNMSLAKSFGVFYDVDISQETKTNQSINTVQEMTLGGLYLGYVKSFDKHGIELEIPGVKDEIVCKENFSNCYEAVQNYLLTHDNKLLFEIREKVKNTYIVSVINAYYQVWKAGIEKCIKHDEPITVHIDDLTLNQYGKGGYVCHTEITPLVNLTGKMYTHSVFIPGSHIVLNIERDFNRWIGQDVEIIPQKFVEFRVNRHLGTAENSLVGSRKRVLQIKGMENMLNLYNEYRLIAHANAKGQPKKYIGTVTGIINSNNKTGIFVELDGMYITGLMPVSSSELLDYKPNDKVEVCVKEFEVQDGKEPFIYNRRGDIVKCNARVVFRPV